MLEPPAESIELLLHGPADSIQSFLAFDAAAVGLVIEIDYRDFWPMLCGENPAASAIFRDANRRKHSGN